MREIMTAGSDISSGNDNDNDKDNDNGKKGSAFTQLMTHPFGNYLCQRLLDNLAAIVQGTPTVAGDEQSLENVNVNEKENETVGKTPTPEQQ